MFSMPKYFRPSSIDPNALAATDSRFRRMLEIEADVRTRLWADPQWRRVQVTDGRLSVSVAGSDGGPG
jgi:hypothetical protein